MIAMKRKNMYNILSKYFASEGLSIPSFPITAYQDLIYNIVISTSDSVVLYEGKMGKSIPYALLACELSQKAAALVQVGPCASSTSSL